MQTLNKRLMFAWVVGILPIYVVTGFLDSYYKTGVALLFVSFVYQYLITLFIYLLLGGLIQKFQQNRVDTIFSVAIALAVVVFFIGLLKMASRFPNEFDILTYVLPSAKLLFFLIGVFTALPASSGLLYAAHKYNFEETTFYKFVDANLGGIVLALLFFSIYFLFATIFNQPAFDFDDIYFDTDSALYRYRFGTEFYKDYYDRTVHPYVLIIVRPWVWMMSLFLKGNMLYGAFIVTALTGALCVFLVWYFVREYTSNSLYASLIAALFGASTSQLTFGSLIENYIFLGAAALIFMVLLLKDQPMYLLVIAGLTSFGITISNIAQTVIAHFFVKRNIPQLIKYGLIVGAFIIPLNLLNNFIYPNAHPYLWEVSTLQFEEKNVFQPTILRANYLSRVMVMHSFVAPDPLLIKEDIPFLKVWLFRAAQKQNLLEIARYETPLSKVLVTVWLLFVALGGILFLKNLFKQDNRFSFAFIFIVLFSFVLHMRYGRDVFLYSTNWTYAITLFLALAWRELANKRWFQIPLFTFVIFQMINNSRLILFMLLSAYLHFR